MGRVRITRDDQLRLHREIDGEFRRLYKDRYGYRNPGTLSRLEIDQVKTDAGIRVQDKRKGRLVP